ncbi:glycosyltransferase family 2 protein [Mobilicoccus massiliensis]|uniref:glycosyltransferase family 2 protein n=1 Tax=Mobilicoccus massiliensis TaxID=1522310 RepID=UPI00069414EF|nr:glycosyltransferase family A protein [Mobilicoccus massiliensis]
MTTICVAVLTYRRPAGLTHLLTDLVPQLDSAARAGWRPSVVVVDNDPDGSARDTVERWRSAGTGGGQALDLRYVHESTPGIAAARNRALAESRSSDLLVFIDDDETPSPDWLVTLVKAWKSSDADAVAGPVRPVYTTQTADWIRLGPFHDAPSLPDGARMSHAASGNLLLDRRVVERVGAEFPQIGTRGGEDSYFTHALTDAGAIIRWCEAAVVTETVPTDRATARWVTTRSLGNGLTWAAVLTSREAGRGAPHSLTRRLATTGVGAARVVAGLGTMVDAAARRSHGRLGLGVHRASRGAGIVAGAWDWVYDEYARPGTRRWRRESASR